MPLASTGVSSSRSRSACTASAARTARARSGTGPRTATTCSANETVMSRVVAPDQQQVARRLRRSRARPVRRTASPARSRSSKDEVARRSRVAPIDAGDRISPEGTSSPGAGPPPPHRPAMIDPIIRAAPSERTDGVPDHANQQHHQGARPSSPAPGRCTYRRPATRDRSCRRPAPGPTPPTRPCCGGIVRSVTRNRHHEPRHRATLR